MTQIVIELWTEHLSVAETAALELGAGTQRNIEILQPQDVDQLMYRASALSLTEAIDAMRSGATVSLRLLNPAADLRWLILDAPTLHASTAGVWVLSIELASRGYDSIFRALSRLEGTRCVVVSSEESLEIAAGAADCEQFPWEADQLIIASVRCAGQRGVSQVTRAGKAFFSSS